MHERIVGMEAGLAGSVVDSRNDEVTERGDGSPSAEFDKLGDELVAYADGEVGGATKIVDLDAPVVLSAWGSFTE